MDFCNGLCAASVRSLIVSYLIQWDDLYTKLLGAVDKLYEGGQKIPACALRFPCLFNL